MRHGFAAYDLDLTGELLKALLASRASRKVLCPSFHFRARHQAQEDVVADVLVGVSVGISLCARALFIRHHSTPVALPTPDEMPSTQH